MSPTATRERENIIEQIDGGEGGGCGWVCEVDGVVGEK